MFYKIAIIRPARMADCSEITGSHRSDRDSRLRRFRDCFEGKGYKTDKEPGQVIITFCLGQRRCHINLSGPSDRCLHFNRLGDFIVTGNATKQYMKTAIVTATGHFGDDTLGIVTSLKHLSPKHCLRRLLLIGHGGSTEKTRMVVANVLTVMPSVFGAPLVRQER